MIRASALNTLRYEPGLCINCGMCSAVCPHGVFAPDGRVARLVRPEACMECGACQMNCPTDAIAVDIGVGCAAAMIHAALTGKRGAPSSCCGGTPEASCTCGPEPESACCGEQSSTW